MNLYPPPEDYLMRKPAWTPRGEELLEAVDAVGRLETRDGVNPRETYLNDMAQRCGQTEGTLPHPPGCDYCDYLAAYYAKQNFNHGRTKQGTAR